MYEVLFVSQQFHTWQRYKFFEAIPDKFNV
jgi:hypothetical protein